MKKIVYIDRENIREKVMSFDVNVFSTKPVIKAAANMQNDGGGGNLGYMSQGRKQKKEKRESLSIFNNQEEDTITISGKLKFEEDENFDVSKWTENTISKIKKIFQ